MCRYGGKPDDYPSPDADLKGFLSHLDRKQRNCADVWDPVTLKLKPWIKKNELTRVIKPAGGCSIM